MTQVELTIGTLCGVDVGALQFALDALRPGTLLAETEFIIHSPYLLLYCKNCENEYVADYDDLLCPSCLGEEFEVRQGQEMLVKAIHGVKDSE